MLRFGVSGKTEYGISCRCALYHTNRNRKWKTLPCCVAAFRTATLVLPGPARATLANPARTATRPTTATSTLVWSTTATSNKSRSVRLTARQTRPVYRAAADDGRTFSTTVKHILPGPRKTHKFYPSPRRKSSISTKFCSLPELSGKDRLSVHNALFVFYGGGGICSAHFAATMICRLYVFSFLPISTFVQLCLRDYLPNSPCRWR